MSYERVVRIGLEMCRQSVLEGLRLAVLDRPTGVPEVVAKMPHCAEQQNQLVWVVRQFAGERLRLYQEHRLVGSVVDGAGPAEEVVAPEPDGHL